MSKGVRRMPVVNDSGGLEGIISADDIVELIAEGLTDLAKLIKREMKFYFPITTMIVISIVLSLLLWLFRR